MSSDGTSRDAMQKELEELVAQSARLREESKSLEERIRDLATRIDRMTSERSRPKE